MTDAIVGGFAVALLAGLLTVALFCDPFDGRRR